jgi:hypothetical protein
MNVSWSFLNEMLIADLEAGTFAQVYPFEGLYTAEIIEWEGPGKACFVADKQDASLIEILHWVEEELKFRGRHDIGPAL